MRFLETTLGNLLREKARARPDRDFIVHADRDLHFTYGEFDRRVDEPAGGLLAIGLKKGDHVGIRATNVPDWNTLLFARRRAGMVLVTIHTGCKTHGPEYLITHSDPACLFIINGFRGSDCLSVMYDLVPELRTRPRKRIVSARFPRLRRIVCMDQRKYRGPWLQGWDRRVCHPPRRRRSDRGRGV
jgi:fatty-acyl-CoA synthase